MLIIGEACWQRVICGFRDDRLRKASARFHILSSWIVCSVFYCLASSFQLSYDSTSRFALLICADRFRRTSVTIRLAQTKLNGVISTMVSVVAIGNCNAIASLCTVKSYYMSPARDPVSSTIPR